MEMLDSTGDALNQYNECTGSELKKSGTIAFIGLSLIHSNYSDLQTRTGSIYPVPSALCMAS